MLLSLTCLTTLACKPADGDGDGEQGDDVGSETDTDAEGSSDESSTDGDSSDSSGSSDAGTTDTSTDGESSGSTEGTGTDTESSSEDMGETDTESSSEGTGETGTGETGESGETGTEEDTGETGTEDGLPPWVAECDDDPANPVILTVMGGASAHYPSIVAAVASASNGSTIEVCPGTYSEQIEVTVDLTLRGAGPDLTIIDGGGFFFDLGNGEATVEDMAFTNCNAQVPGGWNIQSSGAISVDDTYNEQETLTIRNCEFYGNEATYGAAVHVDGSNNGGKNPDIYIEDSLFEDNLATAEGGAIASYGRVHITDSIFQDNEARTGGALALSYGCVQASDCDISSTIIQRNHASGTGQYEGGGGIFIDDCGFNCLSQLSVVDSDLGFGAQEENTNAEDLPEDVLINDGGSPWNAYGWYYNGVSFTCAAGSCTMP